MVYFYNKVNKELRLLFTQAGPCIVYQCKAKTTTIL